MEFIILFLTSLIATLLSAMSGGGSSVIAVPVFLSMGISFPLATLAQKISAIFWVVPAAYNYLKGKTIDWLFLIYFSLIGLVGSYFGIIFFLSLNQRIIEIIIGLIILVLVIYTYFKKDLGLEEKEVNSKFRRLSVYPSALVLGFYESFFGSGNGIIFAILAFYTRGVDFMKALGYYYALALPWDLLVVILLLRKVSFDGSIIIPVILGSVIGGYAGSKLGRYKGNKFIKMSFVVIGFLLALKLLSGL